MTAIIEALWLPDIRLVVSQLAGTVAAVDVARWSAALDRALAGVPGGTEIVLLSNLHGYEPADLAAHQQMRGVIPTRLATLGLRTGLVDLVGGALVIEAVPRVICSRVAHVHHDATKMAVYEAELGSARERFFSDVARANEWLLFDERAMW